MGLAGRTARLFDRHRVEECSTDERCSGFQAPLVRSFWDARASEVGMLALRLRWALRDARARWVQVAGIALMIAIGTGMYAGLSSVTQWRFASNDASLSLTNMYDVRARPSGDGFLPQGALASIAEGIEGVEAVEERLISETQVEVETDDGPLFVRGRIVGVDMSGRRPQRQWRRAPGRAGHRGQTRSASRSS